MARPWPDRYTRARLGVLKGFVVRPRMGPITQDNDETDLIVRHGGWAPPFTDEDGELNLADGVNPGEVVTLGTELISNTTHLWGVQFETGDFSGPRYNVNGESARRKGRHIHGVIDWRSADRKRVVSWVGLNRYSAPGFNIAQDFLIPNTFQSRLWYKGRHVGTLDAAVRGACVYVDTATETAWLVAVTFKLNDTFSRENNDYTEAVWMRPLGRDLQDDSTTPEAIDALIEAAEDPALSQAQKQGKLDELAAELRKWQQVHEIDAHTLLPVPPTGDPKVAPLQSEVGSWLFNASGNECQTIRAVMADSGGAFDPEDFEPQDRRRLKIQLAYTITEQTVIGTTIHRPAASIAQAQAFATLTGTIDTTETVTNAFTDESKEVRHEDGAGSMFCSGSFEDVRMAWNVSDQETRDEDYTLTFAVDYAGDQEVFGSVRVVRSFVDSRDYEGEKETRDECGDPQWAGNGGFVGTAPKDSTDDNLISYEASRTDSVTETYDLNGVLISRATSKTEIDTGPWTEIQGGQDWEGSQALDDDLEALAIRWLDLRDGIAHVVETAATEDDGDGDDKAESKSAIEKTVIGGTETTLQADTDARTTPSGYGRVTVTNDAFVTAVDDSSSVAATFQNLNLNAGNFYDRNGAKLSIGWASDGDGVYVGSALLGEAFRPYGASGPGPHGHETVYNRYDGAAESIQDLFGIQAVNPGDVFVCYPLAFVGE